MKSNSSTEPRVEKKKEKEKGIPGPVPSPLESSFAEDRCPTLMCSLCSCAVFWYFQHFLTCSGFRIDVLTSLMEDRD